MMCSSLLRTKLSLSKKAENVIEQEKRRNGGRKNQGQENRFLSSSVPPFLLFSNFPRAAFGRRTFANDQTGASRSYMMSVQKVQSHV